jgi:hypothetical protein
VIRSPIVLLFGATLFLGSLLMFAVEPMVAKSFLPVLGGTPMVWNTCVLFFQIMLVGGYAYAHGVTKWLGSRRSSVLYLALLTLPVAVMPLALRPAGDPPIDGNPVGWLLFVLLTSIGLPFFALSATASILQRWFAETDHPAARRRANDSSRASSGIAPIRRSGPLSRHRSGWWW